MGFFFSLSNYIWVGWVYFGICNILLLKCGTFFLEQLWGFWLWEGCEQKSNPFLLWAKQLIRTSTDLQLFESNYKNIQVVWCRLVVMVVWSKCVFLRVFWPSFLSFRSFYCPVAPTSWPGNNGFCPIVRFHRFMRRSLFFPSSWGVCLWSILLNISFTHPYFPSCYSRVSLFLQNKSFLIVWGWQHHSEVVKIRMMETPTDLVCISPPPLLLCIRFNQLVILHNGMIFNPDVFDISGVATPCHAAQ